MFCNDIHCNLAEKHIRADPCRSRYACSPQNILYEHSRKPVCGSVIKLQIICRINKDLVNRISENIFRRDILKIYSVYLRTDLHVQ